MVTISHKRYSIHPWTDDTWCAEFDDHAPSLKKFCKTAETRVRRPLFLWICLRVSFRYPMANALLYYSSTGTWYEYIGVTLVTVVSGGDTLLLVWFHK